MDRLCASSIGGNRIFRLFLVNLDILCFFSLEGELFGIGWKLPDGFIDSGDSKGKDKGDSTPGITGLGLFL